MKAYCITLLANELSVNAYETLVKSSKDVGNKFEIEKFAACTPRFTKSHMEYLKLEWTYPWEGERTDLKSGLTLRGYPTAIRDRRVACFLSHYQLWEKALVEPILVLEHDALFIRKLEPEYILESDFNIIGINDPRGATRKSREYFTEVTNDMRPVRPVPRVDKFNVPQGLAGNSAYIIKPEGARLMIEAAKTYGAWPNDALMCYQLINKLGVTNKFYTKVQGLRSTTTI